MDEFEQCGVSASIEFALHETLRVLQSTDNSGAPTEDWLQRFEGTFQGVLENVLGVHAMYGMGFMPAGDD